MSAGTEMSPEMAETAGERGGNRPRRVAVVGGGIAGLTAAWFVRQRDPHAEVTVFEGSPRVGGKLALGEVGGAAVDLGAESVLNRRPEAVDLIRAVGLAEDLVHPEPVSASVWSRGELVPMPKGHLMGIPGDPEDLRALLSPEGLARAAAEGEAPAPGDGGDISVGAYTAARYGQEVVDRLVEPLLGGVYAGHADELSLRAAIPALAPAFAAGRPVDEAVRKILGAQAAAPNPSPVFAGIRGGVGRFPIALAEACEKAGISIRTSTMVRELGRTPSGWRLVTGPVPAAVAYEADAVVVAVPGAPAARLLREVAPTAAAELAGIEYASVALATFVFESAPGLVGSGFLVPPVDGRFIKASTFSSGKWAWSGAGGRTIVRASVGRHRETADLQREDAELAALALADVRRAVGPVLDAEPLDRHVQRWGGGLPQYAVGHVDRVGRIKDDVARRPGLAVCGAAYDGVGIAACVASGMAAAAAVAGGTASAA